MRNEHFSKILNDSIELCIYSEGGISFTDIENISVDELPYIIYTFRDYYNKKQENKSELIKKVIELAKDIFNNLIKALSRKNM